MINHVPPIFGKENFGAVSNCFSGGASFKKSIVNLDKSFIKFVDRQLHQQIRNSESVPNGAKVNFRQDFNVLFEEIDRLIKPK